MEKQTFCRNPYNVTGLCSRKNCPPGEFALRYDSRGERQVLSVPTLRRAELTYRCMKTIERASAFTQEPVGKGRASGEQGAGHFEDRGEPPVLA